MVRTVQPTPSTNHDRALPNRSELLRATLHAELPVRELDTRAGIWGRMSAGFWRTGAGILKRKDSMRKIDIDKLRMLLATCSRMEPLLERFTILEVAEAPVMPLSEWTEAERAQVWNWAEGGRGRLPMVIARYLATIGESWAHR